MKDRIRKIRTSMGLNMEQFSNCLGISASTVSLLESGKRKPSFQLIKSMCREFHVNEEWLTNGEGEMFTSNRYDKLDALCDEYHLGDVSKLMIQKFIELPAEDRAVIIKYVQSIAAPYIQSDEVKHDDNPSVDNSTELYKKELSEIASTEGSSVSNTTAAIGDDEKKVAE